MSPPSRPVNGRRGRQFTRALRTSRDQGAAPTVVSETRGCVRRCGCARVAAELAPTDRENFGARVPCRKLMSALLTHNPRRGTRAHEMGCVVSSERGPADFGADSRTMLARPKVRPRSRPLMRARHPSRPSCALFFSHALSERRGRPAAPPLDADARIVPHDPAPKIPRVHSVDPDRHVPS